MPVQPIQHKPSTRRPSMRRLAACLPLLLAATAAPAQPVQPLSSPAVERRVDDLLARMTLEEKIGQLNFAPNGPSFDMEEVRRGHVGAASALTTSADIFAVQRAARESRLGIPLLIGLDVVHGYRTMFPLGMAEAGSFDPALGREAAEISAREARAQGYNWTFAPMADLTRDARWGRGIEGFGEDPYLGSLFTRARVEGYRKGGLITSLKHFAGYGAAAGGRDYDGTEISKRTLYDVYLPPFRAGIEAGAETVMSAFHTLNGVPATASPLLLTEMLRGKLGFRGFVVSDWQAINQLVQHGVAKDDGEAALLALRAGTEMDMAGETYRRYLAGAVRSGALPAAVVDEAARRVLRVKAATGLLDRAPEPPVPDEIPPPTAAAREAARRIARDTIVLLRNEGALPLDGSGKRITLIGGMATSGQTLLGPHLAVGKPEDTTTVLTAMQRRTDRAGMSLVHSPGCDAYCLQTDGFAAAEEAARGADLVVAIMGEPDLMTGEGGSRAHLTLPGRQRELLERLVATGRPVVLVLVAGRPIELGPIVDRLAGLLMAWFPGTEGGAAITDILFGDAEPSAKLAISWPRTVGQVPLHYDRLPTGRPFEPGNRYTLRYADEHLTPLFPFGFGMTYTRFSVSAPVIEAPRLAREGSLAIRVRLANAGTRPGREVVQLYIRQTIASISRPVRQLKAFEKVALGPGESRNVTLRVPAADLGFHREDGSYVVETGPFEAYVGLSSGTTLSAAFEVVE
jgi:beta-glucosidase